jgi:hypothetical protein
MWGRPEGQVRAGQDRRDAKENADNLLRPELLPNVDGMTIVLSTLLCSPRLVRPVRATLISRSEASRKTHTGCACHGRSLMPARSPR